METFVYHSSFLLHSLLPRQLVFPEVNRKYFSPIYEFLAQTFNTFYSYFCHCTIIVNPRPEKNLFNILLRLTF
jgi:hypothetical protein